MDNMLKQKKKDLGIKLLKKDSFDSFTKGEA